MEALETIKSKTQTNFTNLLEQVQSQPDEVKVWGITAGSAVAGAVAMTAAANGILALLATLASPPVALTIGAVGGGIAGWTYINNRQTALQPEASTASTTSEKVTPIPVVATLDEGVEQIVEPVITEKVDVAAVALTSAESGSEDVATEPVAEPVAETTNETIASVSSDNLEAINGIGPVYANRLRAAGVSTFAQLAELTPERIREIIGAARSGHMTEPEKWIVEARQLAEHKEP